MTAPHRLTVRLRPGPDRDSPIECKLPASEDWRSTGLHPKTVFNIQNDVKLEDLIRWFEQTDDVEKLRLILSPDTQRRLGQLLLNGLFSNVGEITHDWIHIVTEDRPERVGDAELENFRNFVLRLPWSLLHEPPTVDAAFLAFRPAMACAITIDASFTPTTGTPLAVFRLPLRPRILLVIPTNDPHDDRGDIRSAEHAADLTAALSSVYMGSIEDDIVRTVTTFEELEAMLRGRGRMPYVPHVIYFYGHGGLVDTETLLEFAPEQPMEVGLFSQLLQSVYQNKGFAPVVWLNACHGASAPTNSGLRSLAPFCSAVITTRSVVSAPDNRKLALLALPDIAVRGIAPPAAIRSAVAALMNDDIRFISSARWARTFVSVRYELWSPLNIEKRDDVDGRDSMGDVPSRLDRRQSLAHAELHIRSVPSDGFAKPLPIIALATDLDAPDVFEVRLVDHLEETFAEWDCQSFQVQLPTDIAFSTESSIPFGGQYLRAIRHALLGRSWTQRDQLPSRKALRSDFARYKTGYPTILVFRHGLLSMGYVKMVRDYCREWEFLGRDLELPAVSVRIVLLFSFDTADDKSMQQDIGKSLRLEAVSVSELGSHLKDFNSAYSLAVTDFTAEAAIWIRRNGSQFRPLMNKLDEILEIAQWRKSNRQDVRHE